MRNETPTVTDSTSVTQKKRKSSSKKPLIENPFVTETSSLSVSELCAQLQGLQKQRRSAMKLRNMLENATAATVASMTGYHAHMNEKQRKKVFNAAMKLMKDVDAKKVNPDPVIAEIIRITSTSRWGFSDYETQLLNIMKELVEQLPIADFCDHPDRRGMKTTILATLLGETGNLSNYSNPAKVWKRLFNSPYAKNGVVHMPSQWRRIEKGLSAADWKKIGYNPRRNATQFSLREATYKQNFISQKVQDIDANGKPILLKSGKPKMVTARDTSRPLSETGRPNGHIIYEWCGPYRKRYDEARQKLIDDHQIRFAKVEDKIQSISPLNDKGEPVYPCIRLHQHATLCASKRFVRDFWNEWQKYDIPADPEWQAEEAEAATS